MASAALDTHSQSIATANQQLIERAYDAFARSDIPTVLSALAPDILWHVPGRGPISGNFRGHVEVLEFFGRFMELSEGTFRIVVDDMLAKDDRVIVLVTESAQRRGCRRSSPRVHAWTVRDGQAIVFWQFQGDQQTEDEFWS
jgi:ketosteroid isomerase-like protein